MSLILRASCSLNFRGNRGNRERARGEAHLCSFVNMKREALGRREQPTCGGGVGALTRSPDRLTSSLTAHISMPQYILQRRSGWKERGEEEKRRWRGNVEVCRDGKSRNHVCLTKRERQNADSRNYKFYILFIHHGTLKGDLCVFAPDGQTAF